jgi:hypothetical protein
MLFKKWIDAVKPSWVAGAEYEANGATAPGPTLMDDQGHVFGLQSEARSLARTAPVKAGLK